MRPPEPLRIDSDGGIMPPCRPVWHALAARHQSDDGMDIVTAFDVAAQLVSDPEISLATLLAMTHPAGDA